MASYRLVFKKSVTKDLRPLPRQDVNRVMQCIASLTDNPRPPGCEKVAGQEKYRERQGDYRIIYEIRDLTLVIVVVKVGHRRDIYRDES